MNTRSSIKEIYILQLDGEIGAFIPSKYPTYSYAPKDEFIGFIEFLRDSYPEHKLRCIRNQGIEDWLKKRILKDKMLDKLR